MKKIKFLKIKCFLLTLLMLWSSLIIVSAGESVEVSDVDIHDVNCKFNCKHIYPYNSNEISFISDEVEVFDVNENLREVLQNEYAELTIEEIDIKIQEILRNKVDLTKTDSSIQEILQDRVGLIEEETMTSSAGCPPHDRSLSGIWYSSVGCITYYYFEYTCSKCGILLSLEYKGMDGSHSFG